MTRKCEIRFWVIAVMLAIGAGPLQAQLPNLFGRDKKKEIADSNVKPASAIARVWSEPVAVVNGESITRGELADELIAEQGVKQLEFLIYRRLLEQELRQSKIEITPQDIDDEFDHHCKRYHMSRREFVSRALPQSNLTYPVFIRTTVWPSSALKKLCKGRVQVTAEDVKKSFEATYGEKIEVRLLVVKELRKAQDLFTALGKEKDTEPDPVKNRTVRAFEQSAKLYSIDQRTRVVGGYCEPICRNSGYPELEREAFAMKDLEISRIIQVPEGYVLMLRVRRIPPNQEITLDSIFDKERNAKETVRDVLQKDLFEKKLALEVDRTFLAMRKHARITNYLQPDANQDAANPNEKDTKDKRP